MSSSGIEWNADGLRRCLSDAKTKIDSQIDSTRISQEQRAKQVAPVLTGTFRDSIGSRSVDDGFELYSDDDAAIYKEYGTRDTPPHPTLRVAMGEAPRVLSRKIREAL